MKKYYISVLIPLILLFVGAPVAADTLIVIPDTQYYSENYTDIFNSMTQWIVGENVTAVLHAGDVVQDREEEYQFQNAKSALDTITTDNIPLIITPGNHDINDENPTPYYQSYFGDYNSYLLLELSGQPVIIMAIDGLKTHIGDSLQWAEEVINQYTDRKVIILTHGYIDNLGVRLNKTQDGETLWQDFIRKYKNIIMVVCGHYPGEMITYDYGDKGNLIYNILYDPQETELGGNGWLSLLTFSDNLTKVEYNRYSPYLEHSENITVLDYESKGNIPETLTPPPVVVVKKKEKEEKEREPRSGGSSGGGGGGGRITLEEFIEKYGVPEQAIIETASRYFIHPKDGEFRGLTTEQKEDLSALAYHLIKQRKLNAIGRVI